MLIGSVPLCSCLFFSPVEDFCSFAVSLPLVSDSFGDIFAADVF